jgi:sodium/proline symporter
MSTTLLVFLIYLVGMIIVGIITARFASKSLDNFILGGRKMWTPVIALSVTWIVSLMTQKKKT